MPTNDRRIPTGISLGDIIGVLTHPRAATVAVATAGAVAMLALASGIWFLSSLYTSLPDDEAIRKIGEMDQATAVYDAAGEVAFTIYKEQRIEVPLEAMSPHLVRAILAVEDQRFYDHRGFDVIRIASAALANLRRLRVSQGGSTITQQLARQSFLTPGKTLRRKLQELILAGRIERRYTKPRILELYLNKVYFGEGLYGAEAASRGYFGKRASELSVAEAALLAGLVKSPSTYAPTVIMERAIVRRNVVLQQMFETGALDHATREAAQAERVALRDNLRVERPLGLYFEEQVRRELIERFGWQRVYQGGLRVFSTIDMDMQKAAEASVAEGLKALDERQRTLTARRRNARRAGSAQAAADMAAAAPLQAALVAMDPQTGLIRAMVGGRDFSKSSFNRVMQARRQPGSAFKPFVYAVALEAGYTPATLIRDLNVPMATLEGVWIPEDEHSTAGEMSLRTALRTSSNRAAVRLLQEVGISRTVNYAKTMGVGDVPSVPSLALGSGEVTLQSLTAAYATFANQGRVPHPLVIRRVEDRHGLVLFTAEESSTRVVSETTAFLMTTMLADVVDAGTGARARRLGFTLPAAGKTGTTNDFKDAWFIGFTPKLVTGVWVGFDQPRTILANGFASDVAVPIWASFMKTATRGDSPDWPRPPADVTTATICRLSGRLATTGCNDVETVNAEGYLERRSMIYTEYFARGTQPSTVCDLHQTRGLFGAIASLLSEEEKPKPPPSKPEETGRLPVTASVETPPAVVIASAEAPERRRSFWSRLFGFGRKKTSR